VGKKGQIKAGQLADLAVLRRLLQRARDEIAHIRSVLTLLGGKVVHGEVPRSRRNAPAMPDWSPVNTFGGYHQSEQARAMLASACGCASACGSMATTMPRRWARPRADLPMCKVLGRTGLRLLGGLTGETMMKLRLSLALAAALFDGLGPAGMQPVPMADYSVGPQYDTTHVYVPEDRFDAFVASFVATFGGTTSKQGEFQVTPRSLTKSQLALTPVGTVSVFGFKTPIPYPFGDERTGYLVTDIDAAVASARRHGLSGASRPFPIRSAGIRDPVAGRGQHADLLAHRQAELCAARHRAGKPDLPDKRCIRQLHPRLDRLRAWQDRFRRQVRPGAEIGQPDKTIRRVAIDSGYGKMVVFVTDGQLPWPYGRDMTGYDVPDLAATLARATAAGVETLVQPVSRRPPERAGPLPGGYIAGNPPARRSDHVRPRPDPRFVDAVLDWPPTWFIARLFLVGAYLLGALVKLETGRRVAEQAHFGMSRQHCGRRSPSRSS
jgi:hypothetical protein